MILNRNTKNAGFIGLFAGLLFMISCQNNEMQVAEQTPVYPTVEVQQMDVTGYTTYPVRVEGKVNSAVRAKVSGYITEVLVDEGQKVNKGQVLFRLETASLSEDAEAAAANVQVAEVEVNRLQPLVDQGIISNVQLETARARLAQARATYNSIAANIDYAEIKSPVDGYVGAIPHRQGALVSPGDPTPLTTVSDIEDVYVYFSMNESDYLNFVLNTEGETLTDKIGNFPPVELEMVNGDLYDLPGEIQTVTGQVNTQTGTVSFRASFPNPNRILANGNSGRIRIPKIYENAVVVPEVSTFEQQGRVYVFRVDSDSVAVLSGVEVLDRINGMAVLSSGVQAGDQIVARGVGLLQNNTQIQPDPVTFESLTSLNVVFK